ncbi:hypothetical protein HN446_01745 [bacterium]|jgi:hypothetical protein|nr:hypothetical protein [bacterium]
MYKSKNLPWKEAVSFSLKSFINNVRIFCLAGALHMAVVVLEKLTLTGINFNLNIEDNTKEAFLEAIKIVSTSSWIFFFIKGIVLSLFVFGLTIGVTNVALDICKNGSSTYKALFGGFRFIPRSIVLMFLFLIPIAATFSLPFLFSNPELILSYVGIVAVPLLLILFSYICFIIFIIVDKDISAFRAIKYNAKLMVGAFHKIILVIFAWIFVGLLVVFITSPFGFVVGYPLKVFVFNPIAVLWFAYVYKKLDEQT